MKTRLQEDTCAYGQGNNRHTHTHTRMHIHTHTLKHTQASYLRNMILCLFLRESRLLSL